MSVRTVQLDGVADFINGRAFKPSEWSQSGIPIIRIQNLTGTSESFNYYDGLIDERVRVRKGDILISWSASLGVYRWNGEDAVLNQHIFKVRLNDGIDPDYFYYAATDAVQEMASRVHGSTMQHITKDRFDSIHIPLPDLSEQKRIAEQLQRADRLLRTRRYTLELSDTFLPSAFLELFGDWDTAIKQFPLRPLEEVVQPDRGITYGIVQAGPEVSDGIPYIKTGDIIDGVIRTVGLSRTSQEIADSYKRSEVKFGDLVMSIRATVGTLAVLPRELDGANLTQGTARIAPDAQVEKLFLLWQIKMPKTQEWIMQQAKGATFLEITLGKLRELPVFVPPLPLQQKFVALVERHEHLRATQREALRQAEHLFQTLLHRTFNEGV